MKKGHFRRACVFILAACSAPCCAEVAKRPWQEDPDEPQPRSNGDEGATGRPSLGLSNYTVHSGTLNLSEPFAKKPPPPTPSHRPTTPVNLTGSVNYFSNIFTRSNSDGRERPNPPLESNFSATSNSDGRERPIPPLGSNFSVTFRAGDFSDGKRSSDGRVVLSNGLSARPIAIAGEYVKLQNGHTSGEKFHLLPDGAGIFPKNVGGWIYASNAENDSNGTTYKDGGVGAIDFNAKGEVIGYKRIANQLRRCCGGGATPWRTWIACEESDGGHVVQTDPYGRWAPRQTALGNLGWYESFAYDNGTDVPTFYVTRDRKDGVLTRFTPDAAGLECYRKHNDRDRWCTLDSGTIDYLYLASSAKIKWTTDYERAKTNAERLYPFGEGVDISDGVLYFTSKEKKRLVVVNLRTGMYNMSSTRSGAFNEQPDQIKHLLDGPRNSEFLLFCEDGSADAGLHGRDARGTYFTVLYQDERGNKGPDETTGLAMSPDGKHLYIAFQKSGVIYDVTRDDKQSIRSKLVDIKYHAVES